MCDPYSGLQILLHGVISLPDATSYDKLYLVNPLQSERPLNREIKGMRQLYKGKIMQEDVVWNFLHYCILTAFNCHLS